MLRWGATFLLLEIATAECNAEAVDERARWLLESRMSPHQQAYLYDALGKAYQAIDRSEPASEYMRRSVAIAKEHGFRLLTGAVEDLPLSSNGGPAVAADWLRSISTELAPPARYGPNEPIPFADHTNPQCVIRITGVCGKCLKSR